MRSARCCRRFARAAHWRYSQTDRARIVRRPPHAHHDAGVAVLAADVGQGGAALAKQTVIPTRSTPSSATSAARTGRLARATNAPRQADHAHHSAATVQAVDEVAHFLVGGEGAPRLCVVSRRRRAQRRPTARRGPRSRAGGGAARGVADAHERAGALNNGTLTTLIPAPSRRACGARSRGAARQGDRRGAPRRAG
jgi:hypothetical protein